MNTYLTNIQNVLPLLLEGASITVQIWIVAGVISLSMGIITGIVRAQKTRIAIVSRVCDLISFVLRGIPLYVQLLIAYFVVPELLGGIDISAITASTISLGLCSAAYSSQIIKSGFDAIPIEEWEAAYVLGYSRIQTIRYLMLPRALRLIMPALRGEFDQLLKSTSIISTLGVMELTNAARNIVERDLQPLPIYAAVAIIYLLISAIFNGAISRFFEKE